MVLSHKSLDGPGAPAETIGTCSNKRGQTMARVPVLKSPDELNGDARDIAEKIVDTRKSLDGPFSV